MTSLTAQLGGYPRAGYCSSAFPPPDSERPQDFRGYSGASFERTPGIKRPEMAVVFRPLRPVLCDVQCFFYG
jgi:hypothetical protein